MTGIERRLGDLYVTTSEPIEFLDPEGGSPIVVYMRKLSDADQEAAERRANAARARTIAATGDRESDIYQSYYSDACDFDREVLVDFVIAERVAKQRLSVEAEIELGEESEWSKDGLLQGLLDAWQGMGEGDGLEAAFLDDDDPRHADAARVFAEMQRFRDEVNAALGPFIADTQNSYEKVSDDDLRHEVVANFFKVGGDTAWSVEFERCIAWLGTYRIDGWDGATGTKTRDRYFPNRMEVEHLSHEMRRRLVDAYRDMSVDVMEGKGSRASLASSPASESLDAAVMAQASGLVTAGA